MYTEELKCKGAVDSICDKERKVESGMAETASAKPEDLSVQF